MHRGPRTSEFWLTIAVVLLITISSLIDLDLPRLELVLVVLGYQGSRGFAKMLPPPLSPPLPPPPEPTGALAFDLESED